MAKTTGGRALWRHYGDGLIDRLVHHCHIVTISGNSYRMRQHTDLWQTLHAPQDSDPSRAAARARQDAVTN